jgi:protein TonB
MWKVATPVFFLLLTITTAAQKNKPEKDLGYFFTADWRSTVNPDSAEYLGIRKHPDDTTWQWWYYHFNGPLITIETYKDDAETTAHGLFAWYDQAGRLDSIGQSYEGKKDGDWLYYTDSFSVYTTEKYHRGILQERKDRETLEKEKRPRDSIKLKPGEIEATFKGGDKAWKKYMESMKLPDRAINLGVKGTVRVLFVVQADGLVADVRLLSSIEYSFDDEAMRLIRNSPRWEPAVQDGKNVKAYRIQPVTIDAQ